jgi:hypothetical protein
MAGQIKRTGLLVVLITLTTLTLAQVVAGTEVESSSVSPWRVQSTRDYQGVYGFGFSEDESELRLWRTTFGWQAQIVTGQWRGEDTLMRWAYTYKNLTNVSVKEDSFYSDQHTGRFVQFNESGELKHGLLIDNPWSSWVDSASEIGAWSTSIEKVLSGRFTMASRNYIYPEVLEMYTRERLKIMRNEIYARYGYRFISGGKMDTYFRKQEWYRAEYENVNNFLTEIEKFNIVQIRMREMYLQESGEK